MAGAIPERDSAETIENNIGYRRKESGGKDRDISEEARLKAAKNADALVRKTIDKGYNSLTPAEQKKIVDKIAAGFSTPEFKKHQTDAEIRVFAERAAKDPEMLTKFFKGQHQEVLDTAIADNVSELEQRHLEETAAFDNVSREFSRTTSDLGGVKDQLDQFRAGGIVVPGRPDVGRKALELAGYEATLMQDEQALATSESSLIQIQAQMDEVRSSRDLALALKSKGADYARPVEGLTVEYQELGRQKLAHSQRAAEARGRLEARQRLLDERARLEAEQKRLEDEQVRLQGEKGIVEKKKISAGADLAEAKLKRAEEERQFVAKMENIPFEAARAYLRDKVAEAEQIRDKMWTDTEAQAQSEEDKKIVEAFGSRGFKNEPGKRWIRKDRPETRIIDKDVVEEDYDLLLAQGPEAYMRKVMDGKVSKDLIDKKMADTAWVESMRPKVLESLVANKVKVGKISGDQIDYIAQQEWGGDLVKNAIDKLKASKEEKGKIAAEGILKHNFMEEFRRMDKKKKIGIIALIIATLGLALPLGGLNNILEK